jgi:ribosome-binding factor A
MPTRRQERLNELLTEELSMLLQGRLDDPRLTGAVVTRVEATRDLSTAKVYVTNYGDDEETEAMLEALEHARGVLRTELGDLGLRRLPELVFTRDKQFESGERVLAILAELERESEPGDPDGTEAEPLTDGDQPRSDEDATPDDREPDASGA